MSSRSVRALLMLVLLGGSATRAFAQPVPAPTDPAPTDPDPAPAQPAAPPSDPTPPAPPAPGSGPNATPAAPKGPPAEPPKEVPFDAFTASPDDPRVPNFLRALRLGKDSLLLGGYIQPGFRFVTDTDFNNDDSDGFEFQNVRLIGRGEVRIYSKLGAEFRFDFDVNNGNFSVRDVYGSVTWNKDLVALDLGQFKVPFGLASIQPESKLQFPVGSPDRRITFDRDLGGALRSWIPIKDVHIGSTVMVGNGEGGFRQRRNLDDSFMVAGRIEVDPLGRMDLEEPDLENRKFQFALGVNAVYNAGLGNELGLGDVGAAETRFGGDARFFFKGISLRGEYLRGFREQHGADPAFQRYAFSVQAGYVLPIPIPLPKFEIVARMAQFDVNTSLDGTEGPDYVVDNTETRVLQFGANAYIAKHAVKIHFLYQLTDLLEGPQVDTNGDVLLGDTIFFGSQFGWL